MARQTSTSITIPSDKRAMRNDELCTALRQLIGSAWDINHIDLIDIDEVIDEIERRLCRPLPEKGARTWQKRNPRKKQNQLKRLVPIP